MFPVWKSRIELNNFRGGEEFGGEAVDFRGSGIGPVGAF
jgi:hypothetical protein